MPAEDVGPVPPRNTETESDVQPAAAPFTQWQLDEHGVPVQRRLRRVARPAAGEEWQLSEYGVPVQRQSGRDGWRAAVSLACAAIAGVADLSILPSGFKHAVMVHGTHRLVALCAGVIALIPVLLWFWPGRRRVSGRKVTPSFLILMLSFFIGILVAFYMLQVAVTGHFPAGGSGSGY